jgi:hypothetical protein
MAILTAVKTPWTNEPVEAYVKIVPMMRGDDLQGVRQLIYRDVEARKASEPPLEMRPVGQAIVQGWREGWAKELSAAGMTPCKLAYAKLKALPEYAKAKDC